MGEMEAAGTKRDTVSGSDAMIWNHGVTALLGAALSITAGNGMNTTVPARSRTAWAGPGRWSGWPAW